MKINKKILFATCGLGIIAIGAIPFLASCSQGASVNLNQYEFNVGSEKYKVSNSGIQKKDGDKWVSYNFDINGKDNDANKDKPEFINNQKETVKQNVYFQVSQYLYNTSNSYLNFLTRKPIKGDANGKTSETGLVYNEANREFELAFGLGLGEGQNTYRVKIEEINFTVTETSIWPADNAWAYGKIVESKPETAQTVEVSNINLLLKYYKINGNSSYTTDIKIDDLKSSNYKNYWKNFQFNNKQVQPTTTSFKVTLNNKLYFNVLPKNIEIKEGETTKYKMLGTVIIDDVIKDTVNNADFNTWPFVYANSQPSDMGTSIKDQVNINDAIKKALEFSYNDFNEYEKWLNDAANKKYKDFLNTLVTITK